MASTDIKKHTPRPSQLGLRLDVLMAPLVSMLGIIVVGILGVYHISSQVFIASFLVTAIIIFFIERALTVKMQKETTRKLALITMACKAFLAGDKNIRIQCPESDNASELSNTINLLLDKYKNHLEKNYATQQEELHQLHDHLQQFAYEIKPIMDGDLRVKSTPRTGVIGVIADVCNALIEDLARLIQWTQYMSNHVLYTTHSQQTQIQEWAEATEMLKSRLLAMTETVEKLVAFILRLDSTLQASIDIEQEILMYVQHKKGDVQQEIGDSAANTSVPSTTQVVMPEFFEHLSSDARGQVKLLEEIVQSAQEAAEIAETLLSDLYTFTQQFQRTSESVVNVAEESSSLAMLADNWRQAAQAFSIPEDNLQDYVEIEDDADAMQQNSTSYKLEIAEKN